MIKPRRVTDLGPMFTDNPHQMVGQDGAYSIPTDKGLLFFFGDTIIGKRTPEVSLWYPDGEPILNRPMDRFGDIIDMPVNCGLIFRGLDDFIYILDEKGMIRELVPSFPHETPDRWRVWCMHGIQIGKKLYLSYIKVKMLEEGAVPVNFSIHGSGLAVGDTDTWRFTRLHDDGNRSIWTADQPMFSSAMLDGRDGWIYLYGVRNESGVQRCYLARVRPGSIEDPGAFMYWTGNGWDSDIGRVVQVMGGMPNEMSVSWNDWLGRWLAVYSDGTDGHIAACTAQRPEGPWSDPVLLHKVVVPEHKQPYPQLIYAAKEHPALARDGGRTLWVTYIEFEEYFPHLLEIELEKINV